MVRMYEIISSGRPKFSTNGEIFSSHSLAGKRLRAGVCPSSPRPKPPVGNALILSCRSSFGLNVAHCSEERLYSLLRTVFSTTQLTMESASVKTCHRNPRFDAAFFGEFGPGTTKSPRSARAKVSPSPSRPFRRPTRAKPQRVVPSDGCIPGQPAGAKRSFFRRYACRSAPLASRQGTKTTSRGSFSKAKGSDVTADAKNLLATTDHRSNSVNRCCINNQEEGGRQLSTQHLSCPALIGGLPLCSKPCLEPFGHTLG